MGVLQSPLLPLSLAVGTALVPSLRFGRWIQLICTVFTIRSVWQWWARVVIVIDDTAYKPDHVAASKEHDPNDKDGFTTPRDDKPDFVEWAPFWPSLPHGAHPNVPNRAADAPYWTDCDGSVFDIRSLGYKQTREKIPSEFSLYDCVGMDMVRDHRKIDGLMDRLPSKGDLPASPPGAPEWDPAWGVPRVFVVHCQAPYTSGWLMGRHPEDDGGFSVVNYFVLSRAASELLAKGQATPSLRLLRRFCEEGQSTKDGMSFKVVGRIEDLEKYEEVPASFHSFNNKPVLLTKTAKVLAHKLPEVMEIEYDVRLWVYLARTALTNYHHRSKEAEIQIGYLVEGKTDDELPEQILGSFKLVNMDILKASWANVMQSPA